MKARSADAVSFRRSLVLAMVFVFPALGLAGADIRVLPEESIPFTAFLAKADFDLRFPGERVPSATELEPGWYVRYEHESLRYFFGPILLESTGRDYRNELQEIVEQAVAQRPSITGYRIELGYEPPEPEVAESSEIQQEAGQMPPPSQPQPRFGLFDFIRRIFGL